MSYGCKKEGGAAMRDIYAEPYVLMSSKAVKALVIDYPNEVFWIYTYAHEENDPVPCLKQWSIVKCQKWLNHHPIDDVGKLYDLVTEIDKYIVVAEKAVAERLNSAEALDGGKKWQGKYPMLCMMHTIVDHDEIKRAYLTHQNLPSG
jgi:hypothetical protein